MQSYIVRCPKCDVLTQHQQRYKHRNADEDDEGGSYYLCTVCHRTRRISVDELAELLYAASRRYPVELEEVS